MPFTHARNLAAVNNTLDAERKHRVPGVVADLFPNRVEDIEYRADDKRTQRLSIAADALTAIEADRGRSARSIAGHLEAQRFIADGWIDRLLEGEPADESMRAALALFLSNTRVLAAQLALALAAERTAAKEA